MGDVVPLENLTIGRICLHEVHRLGDDGNVVTPTYGSGLLQLNGRALDAFRARVVAAFKNNAQCMEMSVRQHDPGSAIAIGSVLGGLLDAQFVRETRKFADALAGAQTSRAIPGGLAVAFDGTVGHPATAFFAVMKAELHEGFLKTTNLQAQFVSDLFLSPKTKLYKIGIFVSDGIHPRPGLPAGWSPIVYDSAMTASQRDAAATYFYSTFLGLDIPTNAAQQVKAFFQKTKAFIATLDVAQEDKVDLFNGLYTYLKLDQGNTVQVSQFADRFMPQVMADNYKIHMRQQRFSPAAIAKDLTEVRGSLRLRRFKFSRSITLSGPPDAVSELVTVSPIVGDGGKQWTQVTIRGPIEAQE
jgi:hypothetical protein